MQHVVSLAARRATMRNGAWRAMSSAPPDRPGHGNLRARLGKFTDFQTAPEVLVLVVVVTGVLSLAAWKVLRVDTKNPANTFSREDAHNENRLWEQDNKRRDAWAKQMWHKGPIAYFGLNNREVLGIKPSDKQLEYPHGDEKKHTKASPDVPPKP